MIHVSKAGSEYDLAPVAELAEQIGHGLHRYGAAAHEIEESLERVCSRLGASGQFFATPTAILASFRDDRAPNRVFMIRGRPGEVDLGRLAQLETVIDAVQDGSVSPSAALQGVRAVLDRPPTWSLRVTIAAFALASAGATLFFGGGWREMAVSLLIGAAIGGLGVTLGTRPRAGRLLEPVAALLSALVAGVASRVLTPLSAETAMLGGLIILVPGLTLTVAISELATRNLVAGTARLTGAFMTFIAIGFGVALGTRLLALAGVAPASLDPVAPPGWILPVALVVTPVALAVILRAEPRDLPSVLLTGVVSIVGARLGANALGPELGAFIGALVVGVTATLVARGIGRPASVLLVPGVLLLVPGSIGFRSLNSLIARDVVSGGELAFRMVLIAVSLVSGLLLATSLVGRHEKRETTGHAVLPEGSVAPPADSSSRAPALLHRR